jgi:UDP-2-acetamido-3-amino-2,3-dideoxy-glucuronate N-acetyltransferase
LKVLRVLRSCQDALESGSRVKISKTAPASAGNRDFMVHETAIVDNDVAIGNGTKIWHFSHILSGARIGEGCSLGQNVVIGNGVRIGNGCKIQNNVSIYAGVELEDQVFCGPSMVFTNVFNPRCEFPRKDEYKQTLVRRGATIGANATIVCGVTIGEYAFIGAGAVVTTDVKPFALMMGNPARHVGWMSRFGKRLDLPLDGDGETVCGFTGDRYRLADGKITQE